MLIFIVSGKYHECSIDGLFCIIQHLGKLYVEANWKMCNL